MSEVVGGSTQTGRWAAAYLWISGLFLGFIISASAAFLWYMANRSLKVMSEEWK